MAVNVNVIGRLGRDSELIQGEKGNFLKFSLATDEFKHGTKSTAWLNVTLNDTKLSEWLKKGRMINVIGTETINTYTDKNGVVQVSRNISADKIEFVSIGSGATQDNSSENNKSSVDETIKMTTGTLRKPTEVKQTEKIVAKAPMVEEPDDDLPF